MRNRGPKNYRSIEEFEREEIRSTEKIGFSLDDLIQEAHFQAEQDFSFDEGPAELDFD
ncbi:MAG: transcriptional regulator [Sandaracinaceae bacterium]|nr:transcriptional regulator [Sandaracinaceae bacterium]